MNCSSPNSNNHSKHVAVLAALTLTAGLSTSPVVAFADEALDTATTKPSSVQNTQDTAEPVAPQDLPADTTSADSTQTANVASDKQEPTAPVVEEKSVSASSSDKGTYQEAGLHALTITYVDETGKSIAPSYKSALSDGESYSVSSPAVGGYEVKDSGQATIVGVAAKGSGDITISVVYKAALTTYKVVHMRQVGPKSSEYRVSDTEVLQAPAGSTVTVAPRSYDNYTCETKEFKLKVTADGNATLTIKYNIVVPTSGIYFQTGGSYVAPITGHVGDKISAPENPTRSGYAFAGWDINGDKKPDPLPTTLSNENITATAIWNPAQTTYLVKYWGENEADNGHYHLLDTRTVTGITGSLTSTADKLETSQKAKYP